MRSKRRIICSRPSSFAIERATGAWNIVGMLGAKDVGNVDTAYRVIADHIRCLTFAITDGAVPSNVGRERCPAAHSAASRPGTGGDAERQVRLLCRTCPGGCGTHEAMRFPAGVVAGQRSKRSSARRKSFGRTPDRGIKLFESMATSIPVAVRSRAPTRSEIRHVRLPGST